MYFCKAKRRNDTKEKISGRHSAMTGTKGYMARWLVLAAILLSGCSGDDAPNNANNNGNDSDIRFNADVWQVMEGTRATTFGAGDVNNAFKVYAYYYNTTDCYINGEVVNYSGGVSSWAGTSQRWPNSRSLDFFAYMPTDLGYTYCTFDPTAYNESTNDDGYSAGTPRIVCANLPVSITYGTDNTQEMVMAYTANQSMAAQGASGVTMTFKRPFARIYFKLSDASGSAVSINSITISGIYNNGVCVMNGAAQTFAWTPSGSTTNFTVSGSPATSESDCYLVIPQNYGTKTFTVNATWTDWSNVRKDVSANVTVNWQAGYSYTYTFTLSKYALKVDIEKFTEQW